MVQQTAYLPEILAGIDRQIGTVEAEYKAALAVAAQRLQEAGRRFDGQGATRGGALVEEAPPELEPETAMTLHTLETRLDQLKELRDWLKIDPQLAGFVVPLLDERRRSAARSTAPAAGGPLAPQPSAPRPTGLPVVAAVLIALLALAAGWLLSIALPAAALLPH